MPRNIYGVSMPENANVNNFLPIESKGITKRYYTKNCDQTMYCEGYLEEHLINNGSQVMCNGCGKIYSTATYHKSKHLIAELIAFAGIISFPFVVVLLAMAE